MKSDAVIVGMIIFALGVCFSSCSSPTVKPDAKEVVVGREVPSDQCQELGAVQGTSMSASGDASDEALKDMIQEASKKLANFVKVEQYSGYGGSVTGVAYKCP